MDVFCCYTPSHGVLYERYFRPTLPVGWRLTPVEVPLGGTGDFLAPDFLACNLRKMELVVESIRSHPGQVLVWSDVDVVFLGDPTAAIHEAMAADGGQDMVFQRESRLIPEVNVGFDAIRCNERTERFFLEVIELLQPADAPTEQQNINLLLTRPDAPRWGYLPWSFYARSHGWPPPADLVLYHANFTHGKGGVQQKIDQFEELAWMRRHGWWARGWSIAKRVPAKLQRLALPKAAPAGG